MTGTQLAIAREVYHRPLSHHQGRVVESYEGGGGSALAVAADALVAGPRAATAATRTK